MSELENKKIENKYDDLISDKIKDIQSRVDKTFSKFFTDYIVNLDKNVLIKDADYIDFVNKFWNEVVNKIDSDKAIWVKILIQFTDGSVRTLTTKDKALKTIKNDLKCREALIEIIRYRLNNIYAYYMEDNKDNLINGFIMKYRILSKTKDETVTKEAKSIKKA